MKEKSNLIKVFIGDEASAILLKSRLEKIGISSLIKNDSYSAPLGVAPLSVDLYIQNTDLMKAKPLITEFTKNT